MEENKKEQQVIMIPTKEYRKLCRKIERLKMTNKRLTKDDANHFKWWQEEEARANSLEKELAEAREVIAGYKDSAMVNLGLKEDGADA